jgi:HPt (histidine-containing phosphotransfer) domain-containing protein
MAAPEEITAIMNRMWAQYLPRILERVAALEAAGDAAIGGTQTTELRSVAIAEAHKLAGTLGTFGLPQGTELAREAETLCAPEHASDAACTLRLLQIAAELRTIIAARC